MNINTSQRRFFRHFCIRLLALATILVFLKPMPAHTENTGEIVPGDVYVAVLNVSHDLETLRLFMGAPKSNRLAIEIHEAAPHDVYFQALTLFEKANRFSFELVRVQNNPPATRIGVQTPTDVLKVVLAADDALNLVLDEFSLPSEHEDHNLDQNKSPTDVFRAIQQVNRQLNVMLEHRFSPSDVFMQVTFSVGYASNLLDPFPAANRIPDEPLLEKWKAPSDVFLRIFECLEIISRVYHANSFSSLELDVSKTDLNNITPSDVYDLASLVVARLDFLQRKLPDIREPLPPFYPGRKFPSDVYQRVGLLKLQLEELEAYSNGAQVSLP